MTKVVSSEEMARIEKLAYAEGASEEVFMEAAGKAVAQAALRLIARLHPDTEILLLCGKGNNGGDAYVAGRHLLEAGLVVSAIQIDPKGNASPLLKKQRQRFAGRSIEDMNVHKDYLIIDGLFGTGFHGSVQGDEARLIEAANASGHPILAIDIPSGLNGTTGEVSTPTIRARETLALGLPKIGCFIGAAWDHVGRLRVASFGLADEYVEKARARAILLDDASLPPLPVILPSRHKYQAGHAQIFAGSKTMPGAGILAAHASLRSGAGLVQLLVPEDVVAELEGCPPEIIRLTYRDNPAELLNDRAVMLIGPGLGRDQKTREFIRSLLRSAHLPPVVDADALNCIAEERFSPPRNAILTPHHGEMHKLLGTAEKLSHVELITRTQAYAKEYTVTIILKGGPTWILYPDRPACICSVGNPGMATAGTGDVLAGVVVALRAQGMSPEDAATLGTYLHGYAGDLAETEYGTHSMIASDIIEFLPNSFLSLTRNAD